MTDSLYHELVAIGHRQDGAVYNHQPDCLACTAGDSELKEYPINYTGVPTFRLIDDAGCKNITEAAEWIVGRMEHGELVQVALWLEGNPYWEEIS